MSPCPWAQRRGLVPGAGARAGISGAQARVWDLWSWPQGCPWLTQSRLSSRILQEEALKEALKELEKGFLRFVQNTWHLVETDRGGRRLQLPPCIFCVV